ncbi:MAG: hypothetical protein HYY43_01170 [Deltaproteobacteria bacterium]|nr:hypothetical protein [Deltaproteobacteria bacterium]
MENQHGYQRITIGDDVSIFNPMLPDDQPLRGTVVAFYDASVGLSPDIFNVMLDVMLKNGDTVTRNVDDMTAVAGTAAGIDDVAVIPEPSVGYGMGELIEGVFLKGWTAFIADVVIDEDLFPNCRPYRNGTLCGDVPADITLTSHQE